jgi:hypothetical protein
MYVGHVVIHGENLLEVRLVRENVDHPREHIGVKDSPLGLASL